MDLSIKFEPFHAKDSIDINEHEWNELLADIENPEIFNSYQWYVAWFQAFGNNKSTALLKVSNGKKCLGIFPLISSLVYRRLWFSLHHIYSEDLQFLLGNRKFGNILPVRQFSVPANFQSGSIRGAWLCHENDNTQVLSELAE